MSLRNLPPLEGVRSFTFEYRPEGDIQEQGIKIEKAVNDIEEVTVKAEGFSSGGVLVHGAETFKVKTERTGVEIEGGSVFATFGVILQEYDQSARTLSLVVTEVNNILNQKLAKAWRTQN